MNATALLAQPPQLWRFVCWAAFSVTFPRRKGAKVTPPLGLDYHRQQVAMFILFVRQPDLNLQIRDGFVRGLRQWAESMAELVQRN